MSKREAKILIEDIWESINNIEEYTKGITKNNFISNKLVIDAVVRNLGIIGEATKNIPEEYRFEHTEVNWRGMAGLRDVVIHGYFSVDLEVIWEIIQNDLPTIKQKIASLL